MSSKPHAITPKFDNSVPIPSFGMQTLISNYWNNLIWLNYDKVSAGRQQKDLILKDFVEPVLQI